MKILFRTYKYSFLILGTVGCVLLYACTTTTPHKVETRNTKIVIKQPIQLSDVDEKKLDDVLKRYDKKLYFFRTWRDGKVVKVRGQGSTTEKLSARTAMSPLGDNWVGPGSVCPNMGGCTQNPDATQKRLHGELSAILAKY
jgi:hypothetical protein